MIQGNSMRIRTIGKPINKITKTASIATKDRRIKRSAVIRIDLTTTPMRIENPTRPDRYSFFNGLKKVPRNNPRERSLLTALFSDTK